MVGLEAVGVGFALLAPVYGLLFQIQRNIGRLSADHENVEAKVDRIENRVSNNSKAIQTNH